MNNAIYSHTVAFLEIVWFFSTVYDAPYLRLDRDD